MIGRALAVALCTIAIRTGALPAQQPTITNAIGMEFVLISPGTMVVGRFQPECPRPPTTVASRDRAPDARRREGAPSGGF